MDFASQNFYPERAVETLKGCTVVELKKYISELTQDIGRLTMENDVFESFLMRSEPSSIAGMNDVVDIAVRVATDREEIKRKGSQFSILTSPYLKERESSKKSILEGNARVNYLQKFDLVAREIDHMEGRLIRSIAAYKKEKQQYNAEIEEAQIRVGETETLKEAFEKEVVGACSTLTHRIPAESFVRFMNLWYKSGQLLLSKIRLNVSCHRQQYKKLKQIHFRRKPMFESIGEGDFIKLETERTKMVAMFVERNHLRKELKDVYSKSHLLMTENRKTLEKQTEETTIIDSKIKKAKKERVMYDEEADRMSEEIDRLVEKKQKIEVLIAKHECPSPMDYIKSKHELFTLKQHLKRWTQRVRIQTEGLHCYSVLVAKKKLKGSVSDNSINMCTSSTPCWRKGGSDTTCCGSNRSEMTIISTMNYKQK